MAVVLAGWAQTGSAFAASHPGTSVRTALADVTRWLAAGDGSGPHSVTGTAADVRRAKAGEGHPAGARPGRAKGELPPETTAHVSARQGESSSPKHGYDPGTSKRLAAKSGAGFDYFRNADGTFTRRVFRQVVNYRDSAGDWQPIDSTLVSASGHRVREKANSLSVSFASRAPGSTPRAAGTATDGTPASAAPAFTSGTGTARAAVYRAPAGVSALPGQSQAVPVDTVVTGGTSDGPLATLALSSSRSVSWSLSGASSVPASVSGSRAEYDGILPDTSLVLEGNGDGVKESIILKSAAAPTSWVFPMSLHGLSLATAADGTVELVDDAGTAMATLPKPYAFDAAVDPVSGEHHENWSMQYSVTTVDGSPAVRMSLDPSWLQDPAVDFPVTVDPTMTVSTSGQTDTTYAEYPYAQDFSSASVLKIGTYDGGGHIGESFIKLPNLPKSNGYHITGAKLGLFDIWASTCGTTSSYHVYPIASSWSVTGSKSWSDRPPTAAAIGTWSGKPSSSVCGNSSLNSSTGQWQYTTLSTDYFQDIALGKTANNGIAVFSSGTDSTSWKQFDSDHVSGHAPYVDVTYAPDQAPDVVHTYPVTGFTASTLTPQLQAVASDPDSWPNSSLTYDFALYNTSGSLLESSGSQSAAYWDVPVGDLSWGKTYYWTVSAFDGWTTTTSSTQAFSTAVAQPLVASHLAQNSGHGYGPEAGNFTTGATDARIAAVGPRLQVDRAYNSLDVRTSGAFGAGWSSMADMRVRPDDDGSGGVVVTGADGRQERFGRNSSELHEIAGVGD
ncbi:DNRLRE domain-containing protein, partial [Streptomyces sp. MS06]|uniref:DNRLRE domain-containing protein n=1 Tax=Streptomyces sp. MS06 TaxID=3385974 RepID=UPI0039A24644